NAEKEINGSDANEPGALAAVQLKEKCEGNESDQSIHPIEFLDNAFAQHSQLGQEDARMADDVAGISLFILASGEGVNEAFDCAGITPFHGRIGHAGERHVEIKRSAQDPAPAADKNDEPFPAQLPGINGEFDPPASAHKHQQPKISPAGNSASDEQNSGRLASIEAEPRKGFSG